MRRLDCFIAVSLLLAMTVMPAHAQDEELYSAEEKARRSHDLAVSDVIYEQENFKALYYQNLQIIELLKEIKEELHSLNIRQAKDSTQT
jgi:hypothetical protein